MTDRRIRIILDKTQAERGARELDDSITGVGRAADNAQFSVNKLAAAIAGLISAQQVLGFLKQSVNDFADFEKGLIGVGKTSDIAGEELQDLGSRIQEIAARVPVATNKLLEIAQASGQLGVSGADNILKFTEVIGKLGLASDLSGEQAATSLARILTVTGTAVSEVDRLASTIVQLGNNYAATEAEIADVATRVSQSTVQFKVSASEVLGISTALKAVGINAELGGTQVGLAFQAINDALRGGGKEMTALSKITGKTQQELSKAFFSGQSTAVFKNFIDGLGRIQSAGGDVSASLTQMGLSGTMAVQVLATMATRSELLGRTLDTANKEWADNIALNKEAETAGKAFAAQMEVVGNQVKQASVAIGAMIAPAAIGAMHEFGELATALSENLTAVLNVMELMAVAVGARLTVALGAATVAMVQKAAAATAATRTVNAYTGAVTTTTRATNIMTAAVTAGSRALSLLGGPAGILLMAAATFATYIAQTREADAESKRLADTTDTLTASIEGLSAAQAKAARVDVLKAIEEQTAEFLRLRDAAESMERTLDMHGSSNMLGVTEERLLKVRGELDTTGQSVQKLYDRLQALDDVIAGSKPRKIEEPEAPPRQQIDAFGNIGDPFEKTAFDRQAEQLKMGTAQLQRELETRRMISQLYRDADIEAMQNQFAQQRELANIAEQERLLTEEAKYLTDQEMRVARFEEMLERETLEAEQVAELRRLFEEQEAARLAAFEEQKTAIAEEGATARAKIDRDEKMARIGTWESMANSGLQILGAFSSNSFKATKVLGIAESGISIVSGVAKALNNPYPANLGFAAQVAAQGAALISKLRSTNLSSGGGAPQISASAPSAPSTPQQPENMRPQEVNRAVVDLRGVSEDQWYKGDKIVGLVKELNKYMGDGNAVIRTEDR